MIDYNAYMHALHLGFNESDSIKIGEDAAYDNWMEEKINNEQQYPTIPCDFCANEAVADQSGYVVCSEECSWLAIDKEKECK